MFRQTRRISLRTILPVAVATLFAFPSGDASAATYHRTTLDRITVMSNGGARRCERLASRFIAFERVVLQLMGEDGGAELLPVAIYELDSRDAIHRLFGRAEAQQMLASGRITYSKFLPGADFHLAVTIAGLYGDEPLQSALMFYAQTLMLSGPMMRRPPWFQLGLAHLVNGALMRDDGSVIVNRKLQFRPVEGPGRATTVYDLPTVLQMGSREANAADMLAFLSVAREFAAFGLLTTEARRAQYRELSVLMQQGASVEDAVRDAFGVDVAQLVAEFERGDWKREAEYRLRPAAPLPVAPPCTPVPESSAAELLDVVAARAQRAQPQGM